MQARRFSSRRRSSKELGEVVEDKVNARVIGAVGEDAPPYQGCSAQALGEGFERSMDQLEQGVDNGRVARGEKDVCGDPEADDG
ncbi:hypothetical protein HYQ46_013225 [Verticillium longisporum]|nr:hypothetical protein HYQ46_013225 [Verticillium longisporum]